MRLGFKSTLLLLVGYATLLGSFAVGLGRWLRSAEATITENTVALLAQEQAALVSERSLETILMPDSGSRRRLGERIKDLTLLSEVVSSISVIDEAGKVVASDLFSAGQQLQRPDAVFAADRAAKVRVVSAAGFFQGGDYTAFLPLLEGDHLRGYLQIGLHSERVAALYADARRKLGLIALAGVLCVGLLGAFLQIQLTRRAASLAATLEGSLGIEPAPIAPGDEFARALQAANRMRRALNEAREQSTRLHEHFEALAKVTEVGVLLIRGGTHVEFANARALELLGCLSTEALKARWEETRILLADVIQGLRQSPDTSRIVNFDRHEGETVYSLRAEVFLLDEQAPDDCLVLLNDSGILDTLETDVRLARQLEGLARVYRTAAHDLRAPLSAIMINLDLLRESLSRRRGDTPEIHERQEHYVEVVREELTRLNRSLFEILTQSTPSPGQQEKFDLRGSVADLGTLLAPQARRQGVELSTELPKDPVFLVGYRDRLKQAILNVAVNALEAMPNGGRVWLELYSEGGTARIRVKDTGAGIPPDVLARIYEMDFSTKGGGSGIGLYVARALVQLHGGEIQVQSREGGGTTVEVSLPVLPRA